MDYSINGRCVLTSNSTDLCTHIKNCDNCYYGIQYAEMYNLNTSQRNKTKEAIHFDKNERGLKYGTFTDYYGKECSIQNSSITTPECIWLGISEAKPKIIAKKCDTGESVGWVDYPLPEEVFINTRMHLTREQVKALIPILQKFVDEGEI